MNNHQAEAASQALADCLDQHIPGIVTGYIAYVAHLDPDGTRAWTMFEAPGQDPHLTRGYAERHLDLIRDEDIDEPCEDDD